MTPSPAPSNAAANLDRWAEVTALVIELRKALLRPECEEDEAERSVWSELRDLKEQAWTRSRF